MRGTSKAYQLVDNTFAAKDVIGNLHALFYSFEVVCVLWVGAKGGQQFDVWGFFPTSAFQLQKLSWRLQISKSLPMDLLHHK